MADVAFDFTEPLTKGLRPRRQDASAYFVTSQKVRVRVQRFWNPLSSLADCIESIHPISPLAVNGTDARSVGRVSESCSKIWRVTSSS